MTGVPGSVRAGMESMAVTMLGKYSANKVKPSPYHYGFAECLGCSCQSTFYAPVFSTSWLLSAWPVRVNEPSS